jgi:urea transport system ATP-binding protein
MSEALILSDIHASYGRREVLRGVFLSLASGEVVAVVGPNGAGKSTLLKVIAGTLAPRSGRVVLRGEDISSLPQFERARRGIGYLMQGGPVFASLTVQENLDLACRAGGQGQVEAGQEEALAAAPDLKSLLGRRAGLLSGGQRQLLAISMIVAGAQAKRVLLLDEPLAGLSPVPAKDILALLKRLRDERRVAILLVEQNLGAAIELSDRLCVCKSGALVREEEAGGVDMRRIE